MANTILDNFEEIVSNADKVMGMSSKGVLQPVPNYAVLVAPLCAYLRELEQRVQDLENNT